MSEPIERDYLETLRSVVTLDVWRSIVQKALDDAQDGNPQARAWVTRIVLGTQPMSLTALAVRESLRVDSFGEIEALAWGALDQIEGDDNAAALGLEGMSIDTAQKETARAERRARRQAKQLAVIDQEERPRTLGEAQPLALPAPGTQAPNGSQDTPENGKKAPGSRRAARTGANSAPPQEKSGNRG